MPKPRGRLFFESDGAVSPESAEHGGLSSSAPEGLPALVPERPPRSTRFLEVCYSSRSYSDNESGHLLRTRHVSSELSYDEANTKVRSAGSGGLSIARAWMPDSAGARDGPPKRRKKGPQTLPGTGSDRTPMQEVTVQRSRYADETSTSLSAFAKKQPTGDIGGLYSRRQLVGVLSRTAVAGHPP